MFLEILIGLGILAGAIAIIIIVGYIIHSLLESDWAFDIDDLGFYIIFGFCSIAICAMLIFFAWVIGSVVLHGFNFGIGVN